MYYRHIDTIALERGRYVIYLILKNDRFIIIKRSPLE